MKRQSQASLRLPPELKREIRKIARAERRTLSNTMELLLTAAVRDYGRGRRIDPSDPTKSNKRLSKEEVLARRIAEIILESNLLGKGSGRLRKQTPGFRKDSGGEQTKKRA